jgi:hypothetical protein
VVIGRTKKVSRVLVEVEKTIKKDFSGDSLVDQLPDSSSLLSKHVVAV